MNAVKRRRFLKLNNFSVKEQQAQAVTQQVVEKKEEVREVQTFSEPQSTVLGLVLEDYKPEETKEEEQPKTKFKKFKKPVDSEEEK